MAKSAVDRDPGRVQRRRGEEPSQRDWVVIVIATVGVVVAGYLAGTKFANNAGLVCRAGGGCETVQTSRYAIFLGVPTALWGALLYAAIGALALAGLSVQRWFSAYVLAIGAVAFSAYLTYLELFVLHAICPYCLVSASVSVALLVALLVRRPAGGRRALRPARLAAWGIATAVVVVVFGAGVYAYRSPRENLTFQEALARHLSQSGAMMYGSFT